MRVLAILGSGLTAGVMFFVALGVVPTMRALPPDRYVRTHQLLGRNADRAMPMIVLTTVLVDVLLAILTRAAGPRTLFASAAALMAGVAGISQLGNVPINRRVRALDPAAIPQDWADPRPAWRRWHLLRTVLALAALAVTATAVVL
ncbi:unnamed protein product [[Actinomadura] parvosata subsp. kistnae]|nr:unnamed protein product [Actinomadura parvosata subsp. kistnae]